MPWLLRLRWVAVCGQATTLALVGGVWRLELPYVPLLLLIGLTTASNLLFLAWLRRGPPPAGLLPGVLVLDTLSFTALLYFSGGPENPFAPLYAIHVAMAAVTLSQRFAWGMAALSALCYGLLFLGHHPLPLDRARPGDLALYQAGTWVCVSLVAGVLAAFVGRIAAALRAREEQLARVRAVAARNERLASLTTLATGAAHELGTPLGTIAVVARELEVAAERAGDGPRAEDARLVREQVDRCRGILDRMALWAEEDGGRAPETISPAELLADLRGGLGERGRVVTLEEAEMGPLRVPRADLVEALVPLLDNALDATGGEGPVRLELSRVAGQLRFVVRDGGPGMDAETLSRASEPFYTTKPPGKGTGLGLHHVRLVAERLGGSLVLRSAPGQGTEAVLSVPEAREP